MPPHVGVGLDELPDEVGHHLVLAERGGVGQELLHPRHGGLVLSPLVQEVRLQEIDFEYEERRLQLHGAPPRRCECHARVMNLRSCPK